ncbi:MAG: hypothetical protein ACFFCS_18955, partial [Candidatus Hodarchaeota archaeon]
MGERKNANNSKYFIIFWIAVIIIPMVLIPVFQQQSRKVPAVDKLVMANLYSWYATPDGPLGEYHYRDMSKYGESDDDWFTTRSTMSGANGTANLTSGIYNATGISGSGSERLILHSP